MPFDPDSPPPVPTVTDLTAIQVALFNNWKRAQGKPFRYAVTLNGWMIPTKAINYRNQNWQVKANSTLFNCAGTSDEGKGPICPAIARRSGRGQDACWWLRPQDTRQVGDCMATEGRLEDKLAVKYYAHVRDRLATDPARLRAFDAATVEVTEARNLVAEAEILLAEKRAKAAAIVRSVRL